MANLLKSVRYLPAHDHDFILYRVRKHRHRRRAVTVPYRDMPFAFESRRLIRIVDKGCQW